ncbi:MAG: Helix-turn-helix protein [Chitinophagaceae bacterium]|nr:Helix-turn-helix protein [Chitinophagaceae bacterium]
MDIKKLVGGNIKTLRENKLLKQSVVAKALNLSDQSLSLIENGRTNVDLEKLHRIADYFGVSLAELCSPGMQVSATVEKHEMSAKLLKVLELFTQTVNRSFTDYELLSHTQKIIDQQETLFRLIAEGREQRVN